MTETEIILFMVECVPIVLAVWILMHLLCEEYLRALEVRGLIPPKNTPERSEPEATETSDGEKESP